MLPAAETLIASWPSSFNGYDVLHGVGTFLFGSALRGVESSGVFVYWASFIPRLATRYYGLG